MTDERNDMAGRMERRARRMLEANAGLHPLLGNGPAGLAQLDILLFLAAEEEGVTTSRCCSVVQAPRTTALRWIVALAAAGLVEQRADPGDRRVTRLFLTPAAVAALRRWLDTATD